MTKYDFPFLKQSDDLDCGPTCLRMIARYYGKSYSPEYINDLCFLDSAGTSIYSISKAAEKLGFEVMAIDVPPDALGSIPLPAVALWQQRHFVVIYSIELDNIYVADPLKGLLRYKDNDFLDGWLRTSDGNKKLGTLLVLVPSFDAQL